MYIKGFDKDLKCRGFQFEVGKEYKIETDRPLELCTDTVFHFCDSLQKIHSFYSCEDEEDHRFCEIEVLGGTVQDDEKCGSNHIKIMREITGAELDFLKGKINGNTGLFNSGKFNSGKFNSGHFNSGNFNSGDGNSGHRNSGHRNSGYMNSGDWNSGDGNSGHRNSGYMNSGYMNSGYMNSGDWNSGDWNSGNWNSGDSNSGNWNSGDFNSCNNSNGIFCSIEPKINIFNKPSDYTITEFRVHFAEVLDILHNRILTEIIDDKPVSYSYNEAWARLWASLTKEERDKVKTLPNFDVDVFSEITGINKKEI